MGHVSALSALLAGSSNLILVVVLAPLSSCLINFNLAPLCAAQFQSYIHG